MRSIGQSINQSIHRSWNLRITATVVDGAVDVVVGAGAVEVVAGAVDVVVDDEVEVAVDPELTARRMQHERK